MTKAANDVSFIQAPHRVELSKASKENREMAVSLIHEMGYDAAVAVCCEHGWRDALEELMDLHPDRPQNQDRD